MIKNYTILFAEDEEEIRNSTVDALSFMSKEVYVANNGKEAIDLFHKKNPDIVFLDIEMPFLSGLDVAKKIREVNKSVPIVIITAYTNTEYFLKAVELHLTTYLLKPCTLKHFQVALKKCLLTLEDNQKGDIEIRKNIIYSFIKKSLFINSSEMSLRNNEIRFLEYMLRNSNRVISYNEFEGNIWEEGMTAPAIRSLVRDIRKYLPDDIIINVPRLGYKLVI